MNYTLMHKRLPVLELQIDEETSAIAGIGEVFSAEHIPVGVEMDDGRPARRALNAWWQGRAIPASRSGLRDALELMNVSSTGLLLLKCFGLSLSDQYWVNAHAKPLDWDRINFFQNEFSEDVGNALFGRASGSGEISLVSPDNTSDGWLKKKWVVAGDRRLLVKGGSEPAYQEPLNEVLASSILKRLGVPHAHYELAWDKDRPLSVCEDFINISTELVSAWHIYKTAKKPNNRSYYQHYLQRCEEMGIPGVREGLDQMLALDYIVVNSDRHFNNFGVVRDAESLVWLGPAPIFDSGTSMWHNQFANRINPEMDAPSKPFNTKHSAQVRHISSFDWLDFTALKGVEEEYAALLAQSDFIDDARRDVLCAALVRRIAMLEAIAARRR
ncbi:MAG: hypothetical protein LBP28_07090 [Coriobacteriales bacterium]|jgi:hypothetical protein|nr:hypothetical protein [Coriobacteriales bacterium]